MNGSSSLALKSLEHTYAEQLDGFYVPCSPAQVPSPKLLRLNHELVSDLGIGIESLDEEAVAAVFSGHQLPEAAKPIAQAYAGHQFGGFVPQLGDGRAHLLGEVVDIFGRRRDIALKGSGRTPFSRGGDGKAAVGPVLREYLIGEAMHALGIPTTRALAAVATGESVMRERPLPGAVLTRVASSHIRVGTFQFFAARGQTEQLRQLADYTIQRHDSDLTEDPERYLLLLKAVARRQAGLVAQWMLVGFIHGVMNTDNMAISGETIDYGPCAFMESYDSETVFSSIDHGGRYAYGNQPSIAVWNLARFAETLLPLIGEDESPEAIEQATDALGVFSPEFEACWYRGAAIKLGLQESDLADGTFNDSDRKFIDDWFQLLGKDRLDFTRAWRSLADVAEGKADRISGVEHLDEAWSLWLQQWREKTKGSAAEIAERIRANNPLYIPRNHLVEAALTAASNDGDMSVFEGLLAAIKDPYTERSQWAKYADPAPTEFTACYKTFCGDLSPLQIDGEYDP